MTQDFNAWWETRRKRFRTELRRTIRRASELAWQAAKKTINTEKKDKVMDKIKVEWTTNHGTAQIYSSGVELALCSDDNKQIGTFVLCKDFFQDAIVAYLHNTTCGIYGYTYNPKTMPPIPQKNLKVFIADAKDTELRSKIPAVIDFLNQIEKKLNVQLTIAHECDSPPNKYEKGGIFLLTADKVWMHAPPLLSCWTLLARNGLRHKIGDNWETTIKNIMDGTVKAAQAHDKTYITYGKPGLDLILEKGIEALFGKDMKSNYPVATAGGTMHHYSGIVSYGSCKAKPYFKDWGYPAKETNPPSVCFS